MAILAAERRLVAEVPGRDEGDEPVDRGRGGIGRRRRSRRARWRGGCRRARRPRTDRLDDAGAAADGDQGEGGEQDGEGGVRPPGQGRRGAATGVVHGGSIADPADPAQAEPGRLPPRVAPAHRAEADARRRRTPRPEERASGAVMVLVRPRRAPRRAGPRSRSRPRPCRSRAAPSIASAEPMWPIERDLRPAAEILERVRLGAAHRPDPLDVEHERPAEAARRLDLEVLAEERLVGAVRGAADVAPGAAGPDVHLDDRRRRAVRAPPARDDRPDR